MREIIILTLLVGGVFGCFPQLMNIQEHLHELSNTNYNKGEFTKILITSGGHKRNFTIELPTEIIDLENPDAICPKLPKFPTLFGQVGGLVENVPIICEGNGPEPGMYSDDCFKFEGNSFQRIGKLSNYSLASDAVVINGNKLWVLGFNGERTEYITKNGVSTPGPGLPRNDYLRFSVANINSTTSMITGGYLEYTVSTVTFYFHHPTQKWISGPNLNMARFDHVSGVVTDTVSNEKYLVVIGGREHSWNELSSIEMLIDNEWVMGPSLPEALSGYSLVPFGKSIVVIGGSTDWGLDSGYGDVKGIHKLTCSNRACTWTKMAQELSIGRAWVVAIPIPDSIAKC